MSDVVGRLFREFAVTLAVTIAISAVVSLTLAPMLCAKLLRAQDAHARDSTSAQDWFDRIIDAYGVTLRFVLAHSRATLASFVATLAITGARANREFLAKRCIYPDTLREICATAVT